jgi:UDP-glucose 4-epimerase
MQILVTGGAGYIGSAWERRRAHPHGYAPAPTAAGGP